MKKIARLILGQFVVLIMVFSLFIGLNQYPGVETSDLPITEHKPVDFEAKNVFYLCSQTITSTVLYLSGVPRIDDGSNPDLNKHHLENGRSDYFRYPRYPLGKAKLVYNQSFVGNPYLQLTLNSYTRGDKLVNVELGIDTDDDNNFEVVCTFPPYHTTGDNLDDTMEEEVFEAYGEWQGGKPPAYIEGWLKLKITMTSPTGENCLVYCGFDGKLSWLALPYMHTDLIPRAKINASSRNQEVMVGDTVWFDGRDSYDPNDDLSGNQKIDGGEIDKLRYRWSFGDGTSTDLDYGNQNVSHVYTSEGIPKTAEFQIFQVNLTVMDNEGHTDWDRTYIKVYRGNHSPQIHSLKINDVEQLIKSTFHHVPVILSDNTKVHFNAIAIDKDGDELSYHWDFDGDGIYDIEGDETVASQIVYPFNDQEFELGKHRVTLVVSDGTLARNATASSTGLEFVLNKPPIIEEIYVTKELDPTIYRNSTTVFLGQKIVFHSVCYDPDFIIDLNTFDTKSSFKPGLDLNYRWHFDSNNPFATTGWLTESFYEYQYFNPGDYKYYVTLDVFDGLNITTSEPFEVNINVLPMADIKIKPISFNPHGNFEVGRPIYFNGSGSYDPNGDYIQEYTWDFGDGNQSVSSEPMHNYTAAGIYTVSLIVSDGEFNSARKHYTIEVPYPPSGPIITHRINPLEVYTYQDVQFDATETYDLDSDYSDLRFKWFFGDNTTSTGDNIVHKYLKPGEYIIILKVTDETGVMAMESKYTVHVLNHKPVARIKSMKDIYTGETVRLSSANSYDVDGEVVSYLWNFGDGTHTSWTDSSIAKHKWKHSGIYTVTLIAQDNFGAANETRIQVEVLPADDKVDPLNNAIIAGGIAVIISISAVIVIVYIYRAKKNI
jgi:PKD repeat protein